MVPLMLLKLNRNKLLSFYSKLVFIAIIGSDK